MAQIQMKWTNWSAHVAWGAVFVAVPYLRGLSELKSLVLSVIAGALWELLYFLGVYFFGKTTQRKKALPSFVDWLVWVVGAGLVVLVM